MSAKILTADEPVAFYDLDEHPHPEGHSTMLGFWIYLMSDCLIFAILFACYAVLGGSYAAGPAPKDLFDLKLIALNTAMLLFSSITYGFAVLQMRSEEHTSELQSLMRTSYAVFCLKKKKIIIPPTKEQT